MIKVSMILPVYGVAQYIEKCKELYNAAKQNDNCDLCCCQMQKGYLDGTKCDIMENPNVGNGLLTKEKRAFVLTRYVSLFTFFIYRGDFLLSNDIRFAEDWCAVFQLLFLSNGKLGYVQKPLYNYYVNADSISFNPHRIEDRKMVEKRIRNCRQMVENCNIVIEFIERQGATERYAPYYVNTKLWAKRLLCRMSNDKEVYRLWRSIYPEIEGHVLFNRYVTRKSKLMYLTTRMRIYPLLTRLLIK